MDIFPSDDRITGTSPLQLLPFLKGSWILLSLKTFSFQIFQPCRLSLAPLWPHGQGLSPGPQGPSPRQPRARERRQGVETQVASTQPSSAAIFPLLGWKRRHSSSFTGNVWKRRFFLWILSSHRMRPPCFTARSSPSSSSGRDLRWVADCLLLGFFPLRENLLLSTSPQHSSWGHRALGGEDPGAAPWGSVLRGGGLILTPCSLSEKNLIFFTKAIGTQFNSPYTKEIFLSQNRFQTGISKQLSKFWPGGEFRSTLCWVSCILLGFFSLSHWRVKIAMLILVCQWPCCS